MTPLLLALLAGCPPTPTSTDSDPDTETTNEGACLAAPWPCEMTPDPPTTDDDIHAVLPPLPVGCEDHTIEVSWYVDGVPQSASTPLPSDRTDPYSTVRLDLQTVSPDGVEGVPVSCLTTVLPSSIPEPDTAEPDTAEPDTAEPDTELEADTDPAPSCAPPQATCHLEPDPPSSSDTIHAVLPGLPSGCENHRFEVQWFVNSVLAVTGPSLSPTQTQSGDEVGIEWMMVDPTGTPVAFAACYTTVLDS